MFRYIAWLTVQRARVHNIIWNGINKRYTCLKASINQFQVMTYAAIYPTPYIQFNIVTLSCNKYIHIQTNIHAEGFFPSSWIVVCVSVDCVNITEKRQNGTFLFLKLESWQNWQNEWLSVFCKKYAKWMCNILSYQEAMRFLGTTRSYPKKGAKVVRLPSAKWRKIWQPEEKLQLTETHPTKTCEFIISKIIFKKLHRSLQKGVKESNHSETTEKRKEFFI